MTNVLPPDRDLPPGRQARIRADLEQAVSGRPRRRLLVPVLAGAAAVAAVVTSVVLLDPKTQPPQPAVHVTDSPAPEPAPRDTFGLRPDQVTRIEQGCARDAKVTEPLRLDNYGQDEGGRWALLYTAKAAVWCEIGRGGEEYGASGPNALHVDWLAGDYSTHVGGVQPGGDTHPFSPALAGAPGYRFRAGRVGSSVARMTWRDSEGATGEVKIANGTFVLRRLHPSTWSGGGRPGDFLVVQAYDAAGKPLDPDSDGEGKCWVVPGTNEAIPDFRPVEEAEQDGRKCQPARPWK
ncbi:hypothetical protein AB0A63_18110 [Lentzea sp. NPDC042327]|uniref:hypothetical protein n=1 Tax=Lentzea sp. NPDC042327 TaxID=3154801 RepID=UPI003400DABC